MAGILNLMIVIVLNYLHYSMVLFRFSTKYLFQWCFDHLKHSKLPPIDDPILLMSAVEIARRIRHKELKCVEVIESFIDRIEKTNILNGVIIKRFQDAMLEAKNIDIALSKFDVIPEEFSIHSKPLLGVPFTAKVAFQLKGLPNTSGLCTRKHLLSENSADVIVNLQNAGAICLGLTNCSELCMWFESSNLLHGRTSNAYHQGRTVGGSSGGEGCNLSVAGSVLGVGSDIGGSIRIPALFNGIFGHKPSSGLVSNTGYYPPADGKQAAFNTTGPMCRYACDLLPMLKVMIGKEDISSKLDQPINLSNLKCYYLDCDDKRYLCSSVDPQIDLCIEQAVKYFAGKGLHVKKIKLDGMLQSFYLWSLLMQNPQSNFKSLMGNYSSCSSLFYELINWILQKPNHTLPSIALGMYEGIRASPKMIADAEKLCHDMKNELINLLGDDGFLLCPTHPCTAYYHNEALLHFANSGYTMIFNILGFPSTHVPMGLSKENLPIGFQTIANFDMDHISIAIAVELEKHFGGWVIPS